MQQLLWAPRASSIEIGWEATEQLFESCHLYIMEGKTTVLISLPAFPNYSQKAPVVKETAQRKRLKSLQSHAEAHIRKEGGEALLHPWGPVLPVWVKAGGCDKISLTQHKWNVLLISVDTERMKHLSL